jgi:hypothetical protein
MDTVKGANGVADVTQILQMATAKNLELAKKMVAYNVETAMQGAESGKGAAVDVTA